MRINCLEPKIYNKIAAGEVVERPASIVKELVENCIDAGSTEITVEVENGGITKIRVTDNGCGICFDDLKKAFLPHATSKIATAEDLTEIKTLGFRGEALASIGAVAKVKLVSKVSDEDCGGTIEVNGGDFVEPNICGAKNGTDIIVEDLFYNIPARAKFLKKPKTEEGEITSLISKFILTNPYVAIKYMVDGKLKLNSSGKGMEDCLYVVYGKEAVEKSVFFESDFGYIKLYGYLGKPEFSKPNKTYETIIINNRFVSNATISSAIFNAYAPYLMKKQFPFYCLYIELDYEQVDVNVHPNKMEVRFTNNSDIYIKTFEAVNRKLNGVDYVVNINEPVNKVDNKNENIEINNISEQEKLASSKAILKNIENLEIIIEKDEKAETKLPEKPKQTEKIVEYNNDLNNNLYTEKEDPELAKERRKLFDTLASMSGQDSAFKSGVSLGSKLLNQMEESYKRTHGVEMNSYEQTSAFVDSLIDNNYKIVGTLFNTYIILEEKDKMLLIDQHAGHERVLFDRFIEEVNKAEVVTQGLLVAYILTVNPIEENYIMEHLQDIKDLGFDIDYFGNNSFKICAVPLLLSDIDISMFFNMVLSDLKNENKLSISGSIRDRIASHACKSAVKAGDNLTKSEIKQLLDMFHNSGTQLLCPHGRPIVISFTKEQLEKWFKRIV